MNSFGRIFRVTIFGESHGNAVGVIIDGCSPGIPLTEEDFMPDLERRKGGSQKGTTPRKEDDKPIFLSGLFKNHTTGSPLTIIFENNNTRSADYEKQRAILRPGHADFIAGKKYKGFEDYRGGGHFSGRLTVGLVAAGVVAKKMIASLLSNSGADAMPSISAYVKEIGGETDLEKGLQKAIDAKDSVGGVVECHVTNMTMALGEPFFDSAESLLSHIVFAIPAVRGIEFGTGFASSRMFGTEHNDVFINEAGNTATNHAGGITGGLTNGNTIVFRIAIKPTASTPKEQVSFNFENREVERFSIKGRHDLCIALRVPPVLEAATAIVLSDILLLNRVY